MANHKSAIKRARQITKKTLRNRSIRSATRTAIRSFREALSSDSADADKRKELLQQATVALRRAGSKGVFHKNNVDRRVGRLVKAFNAAAASAS